MGTSSLPDIYTQSTRATDARAEGIYRIGQKFGGRKVWQKCVKYQFGE